MTLILAFLFYVELPILGGLLHRVRNSTRRHGRAGGMAIFVEFTSPFSENHGKGKRLIGCAFPAFAGFFFDWIV